MSDDSLPDLPPDRYLRGFMLSLMRRRITYGDVMRYGTGSVKFMLRYGTFLGAGLMALWIWAIYPAIAQVVEDEVGQRIMILEGQSAELQQAVTNLTDLAAQLEKSIAATAETGIDSREVSASNKELVERLDRLICLETGGTDC